MQERELEICVETLQGCEVAVEGGADRIELCAALSEGGVTPSHGLIRAAVIASPLPVHVLIRPRSGNFVYSADEFQVMCADVEDAVELGAAGLVLGLLTRAGEVDRVRTAELVGRAGDRPVTFHRAFDQTQDLFTGLEALIDLGCSRILTSGGRQSVMGGFDTLRALTARAAGRIRIAAGGGVTLQNAVHLTGIKGLDLHASLRAKSPAAAVAGDPLWSDTGVPDAVSAEAVRALGNIVHAPR